MEKDNFFRDDLDHSISLNNESFNKGDKNDGFDIDILKDADDNPMNEQYSEEHAQTENPLDKAIDMNDLNDS